jgi:predicted DNA-binding transcriptional regulator YafY
VVALKDEKVKKYYLKTLSYIENTSVTFTVEENIETLLANSINIWFKSDVKPFEVKLYADEVATKYFKRRALPTQVVETLSEDGTIEFTVTITDEMEIMPLVKYWLPHLRVLEPLWIAEMIDKDLESYLQKKEKNEY